jgi:hypothetical protein
MFCRFGYAQTVDLNHAHSLCDQIFTSPIQWTAATNFPETATHAIDFGPGGTSGIGPLTARNLDGRGVRVIIVGDKGKGGAEVYDSQMYGMKSGGARNGDLSLCAQGMKILAMLYGILLMASNI